MQHGTGMGQHYAWCGSPLVGGDVLGKDFDGDGPVEAGVSCFVRLSHAPSADRSDDLVWAKVRTGVKGVAAHVKVRKSEPVSRLVTGASVSPSVVSG